MRQAMIFAAGLGTRLRPLTNDRPKALVEVAGRPLLGHLLLKLRAQGFTRIVINIHHFGGQIIDFLSGGEFADLDIRVSDERACLLNTGGAVKHALPLLDTSLPVLIHNADIVSDIDLTAFYDAALASDATAALMVSRRRTSRYLLFDSGGRLCGRLILDGDKAAYRLAGDDLKADVDLASLSPQGDSLLIGGQVLTKAAFSGIHVLKPEQYEAVAGYPGDAFPIVDYYLGVCRTLPIGLWWAPEAAQWEDCGKPESLAHAAQILCSSAYQESSTTD